MAGYVLLGGSVSWLAIWLVRRKASTRRAADFHHHQNEIPRLGGLGLATALAVISLVAFLVPLHKGRVLDWALALGPLAMFGLGLLDDLRSLGAKKKLLGQILIASTIYFGGIRIEVLNNPFTQSELALGYLSYFATIFWIVGLTNLINLVDGIDGLAGGISLMLMCLLAYVGMGTGGSFSTVIALVMAGALLGFLYFNFPPASIYMGDGGAYFLGCLISVLSMSNSHKGSVAAALIAPMFALALPILDVVLAICRRGLKGLPIFRPDRKHIHHHLLQAGFSRERAVLILYTVSFLCLFLAFGVFWSQGKLLPLLTGGLFVVFLVCARSFGFINDWLAMGGRLARSLAMRSETRYALTLAQWLEMEAERRDSVYELWQDFQFLVKKLGFAEVTLVLPDSTNVWRSGGFEAELPELQRQKHQLGKNTVIEFAALRSLPAKSFELLSELAAESWHKAATRWESFHKQPVQFVSVATPETSYWSKKVKAYSVLGKLLKPENEWEPQTP